MRWPQFSRIGQIMVQSHYSPLTITLALRALSCKSAPRLSSVQGLILRKKMHFEQMNFQSAVADMSVRSSFPHVGVFEHVFVYRVNRTGPRAEH